MRRAWTMVGSAGVLDFTMDGKEGFLGNGEPPLFEELRVNDGVGHASFIFEADEDESFGGAGALAANDHSRDANVLSISALRQIARQGHVGKSLTNEGHGMASRGDAGAGKIGIETLKGIHAKQEGGGVPGHAVETGQIFRPMRSFRFSKVRPADVRPSH